MVLRIEKLSKKYKDVTALKSLDFCLNPGESVALLGPNGAGKSTAIKLLTTLISPDSGTFHYGDEDLFKTPHKIRDLLGYVSQEMAMDKQLTGSEFIRFCAGILHLPWKSHGARAMSLLDQMGLSDAKDRLVGTYSGGMKRRLDLASALLHDPKILVLDEPTTGLDIEARETIWGLIKVFMAKGRSLILASHDFREVDELAAQVLILDKGEVVRRGSPDDLKTALGRYIIRLKTSDYMIASHVEKVCDALSDWGDQLLQQHDDEYATFIYRGDQSSMQVTQDDIYVALKAAGLVVKSLNIQSPSLEDVYRFATGELV